MLQILGVASGILGGICYFPYIKDIFKRTTKPERASWLIWTILGLIAFFSQMAEGAAWSLFLTGFDTIGVVAIFILSIKYGVGGVTRRDVAALIAAGIGLMLWYVTSHAVLALLIIILIDAIGTCLTVIKAYKDPESETISMWLLVAIAGVLGAFSVGTLDPILLTYPIYIFLANIAVVGAIHLGKIKKVT